MYAIEYAIIDGMKWDVKKFHAVPYLTETYDWRGLQPVFWDCMGLCDNGGRQTPLPPKLCFLPSTTVQENTLKAPSTQCTWGFFAFMRLLRHS